LAWTAIQSETPLVPDTLPALKTCWYTGGQPHIYTAARFYLLQQSLQVALTIFERTPPAESRAGFAFGGISGHLAVVFLAPDTARLALLDGQNPPASWPLAEQDAPPFEDAAFYTGQDEQGWYWGARLGIGPEWLEKAGIVPAPGATFGVALAKYSTDSSTLGLSFPLPPGAGPFEPSHFTATTITR